MDTKAHWERVYQTKAPNAVSWYRPHLDRSLDLIQKAAPDPSASIIDVGGGQSTLVDDLLARGYSNLTILDVSQAALQVSKTRVGDSGKNVRWLCADVTTADLPFAAFDVWHDRAVFHFLTDAADRSAYVRQVERTLKSGGQVVVATFGPEGPKKCSGLDTMRYDSVALQRELGDRFKLIESSTELHETPTGADQQFTYCRFRLM